MACMNSNVLARSYAISGVASLKLTSKFSSVSLSSQNGPKLPVIKAQQTKVADSEVTSKNGVDGRRAALLGLAAAVNAATSSTSANAGVIEDYLEKSKTNMELNDKKRLLTCGANLHGPTLFNSGPALSLTTSPGAKILPRQRKRNSFLKI